MLSGRGICSGEKMRDFELHIIDMKQGMAKGRVLLPVLLNF